MNIKLDLSCECLTFRQRLALWIAGDNFPFIIPVVDDKTGKGCLGGIDKETGLFVQLAYGKNWEEIFNK